MTLVEDFFHPWEKDIKSFSDFNDVLAALNERWVAQGRLFAWRGVVDASWPLHSSLYRRLLWTATTTTAPNEARLYEVEGESLTRVHQWGLHHAERGRLSILAQLATLQHFGAPTRLIDVTMNAYIGLWFAVEEKWRDGRRVYDDTDGRLFAIDVTNRLINEDDDRRKWEDAVERPWRTIPAEDWSRSTWAWRPPAFTARIASQHGAFLFGGVPRSQVFRWPKEPRANSPTWPIDDVRRCTSIPLRMHKAEPEAGGVPQAGQPAYTFRIKASAKKGIRERLWRLFGYSHATIYPDYPGFADFGMSHLRNAPPPVASAADA